MTLVPRKISIYCVDKALELDKNLVDLNEQRIRLVALLLDTSTRNPWNGSGLVKMALHAYI